MGNGPPNTAIDSGATPHSQIPPQGPADPPSASQPNKSFVWVHKGALRCKAASRPVIEDGGVNDQTNRIF